MFLNRIMSQTHLTFSLDLFRNFILVVYVVLVKDALYSQLANVGKASGEVFLRGQQGGMRGSRLCLDPCDP